MESIRNAILTACMLSACIGMLSALSPGGTLARQMKFLVSLVFAVCLALPFTQMELPPALETLVTQEAEAQQAQAEAMLRDEVLAETKTRLEASLTEALAAQGITCESLTAELHMEETGCIHITRVTAVCSDFAGANAVLSDLLGEEAEIVVTEILS